MDHSTRLASWASIFNRLLALASAIIQYMGPIAPARNGQPQIPPRRRKEREDPFFSKTQPSRRSRLRGGCWLFKCPSVRERRRAEADASRLGGGFQKNRPRPPPAP